MERRKIWTQDELQVLDCSAQPIWLYSCSLQRILWGNKAAQRYFNRELDQLTSFKFGNVSSTIANSKAYRIMCTVIQDEVEVGGSEHIVSGFGVSPLPGVIPHADMHQGEFLYKQCLFARDGGEPILTTMVQLVQCGSTQVSTRSRSVLVKTQNGRGAKGGSNGSSSSNPGDNLRVMLDVLEGIMSGKEVDLDNVSTLHQSILRGEVMLSQPTQIAEQLVNKEELDQDVGLNLLQLLGSDRPKGLDLDSTVTTTSRPTSSVHGSVRDEDGSSCSSECVVEVVPAAVPSHLVPAIEQVLNSSIDEWRFDAFKLAEVTQGHPLSTLGFWLMKKYDIIQHFHLDAVRFARFLRRIEEGYPDNPYHNRTHAADVLQGMHVLLTKGGLVRRLKDELAMFAGYLSAIVHDYEHKGFNNDFLVRVDDDLAVLYNDMSPMENHHVSGTFKLIRNKEFNFLANMPKDKRLKLRKLLIDMVLATDMKQHFSILSKFQAKLQVKLRTTSMSQLVAHHHDTLPQDESVPITEDEADKSLILQVGLKCADVGHLAAPWEVHHRWVSGLEEEFFRQGDQEKNLHLNISPLMDRCKDGITRSQVGFFDIVALPLFYSWATVFHDALPLVRAVEENCNRWKLIEAARSLGKAP